jgi:hypothetical protein
MRVAELGSMGPTKHGRLFEAKCSCGWTSEYAYSDPEAAEDELARHRSAVERG